MEQLTRSGSGYFAHESADGAGILYPDASSSAQYSNISESWYG